MATLWLDLETFSEASIAHGVHAYAEHPSTEILLFAWAIDDGPAQVWDAASQTKAPEALRRALRDPAVTLCAHNAQFDRTVLQRCVPELAGDISRWRCTMAQALAHSLPGKLDSLCTLLGVPTDQAKDKDGRALVLLFCKPRPASSKVRRATRETHPAEWARFVEYARLDVQAMRAVAARMPDWNYGSNCAELDLWRLDQRINSRGVAVDTELVNAAIEAVDREQQRLADQTHQITDGGVPSATQRDVLLRHLLDTHGVDLPDMQQSTLERRINDPDLPEAVRDLLAIRLQASTTSTAKYRTLALAANRDGRLRGTLQFCGASRTGRWAGRVFQPQNLPRITMPAEDISLGIDALKAGCADLVFDNVMDLTRNTIRGCLVAGKGKKLVVADLANIEGRVLAWLAGEDWKLQAFRNYDAGSGHDLYKLAYARSFGVKAEAVGKDQRQIGKVQELALGYEGGVGAFITFANAYNIDLEALGAQAAQGIPAAIMADSRKALEWARSQKRPTFGLSDRAWLVCESFKRAWREAHPAIVRFWRELEAAAIIAVEGTGGPVTCRGLHLDRQGNWLRIRLPSGRYLCYPSPRIVQGKLTYKGMNQYSRKWCDLATYGGKLAENVTQAVSRDVLAAGMPRIEREGYSIALTVHDEIISEAPDTPAYSAGGLADLMTQNPPWAQGLPLAAAGYEDHRYRKD